MANAIPIAEGTDASGGYLVHPEYRDTLIDGLRRESAVVQSVRVDRVSTKKVIWSVYAGRPTVTIVAEGAEKTATGAEFNHLDINIKKLATIVLFTEEMLEDAAKDPRLFVGPDVAGAIADAIDANALGQAAGADIVGGFDAELTSSTNTTELGTTGDAFALSVSAAMELIEANGYKPTAVIAASDVRAHLRDQRGPGDNSTTPVYTPGFNREPDTIYNLPIRYSSNLDGFPSGAAKTAGVVLDGQESILAVRDDVRFKTSTDATVTVGGTPHNTWQRNEVALLWETRVGFNVHDINKSVSPIINHA